MNLASLKRGLIVSCQAGPDHPLRSSRIISALAVCAERGGAVGIRADGPEDVREVKGMVSVPVIGIHKVSLGEERSFITPTFEHASGLVSAGADLVALEATHENRPDDERLRELITRIRRELETPVMADVSVFGEGIRAWKLGANLVATTLSGYTHQSRGRRKPDLELVKELAEEGVRTVCEGHIRTPQQAREAFELGAWSVVVGTAITDPMEITSWFVECIQESLREERSLYGERRDG